MRVERRGRPARLQRGLAAATERLERAQEKLRIVEEQLLFQLDVVEEARTRMLVSETPLADRAYRVARDDYERLRSERERYFAEIDDIRREQDRLLDRLLEG